MKKKLTVELSVDVGNTQVCVRGNKNYQDVFDSCFNIVNKGLINDDCVEFTNGKFAEKQYQVVFTGEQKRNYAKEKELENHVFVSFALMRYLREQGIKDADVTLDLSLGVPVKEYNKYVVEIVKSWFKKPISFTCNGMNITYTVNECVVCPQGLVYQMTHKSQLSKLDIVYLMDLGGFTVDLAKIVRGVAASDSVHSLKVGSSVWLKKLAENIENDFQIEKFTEKQAEIAVKKGYFMDPNSGKKVNVKKQYSELLKDAVTELVKSVLVATNKTILQADKVIVFGGGAYTWGATLEKTFNNVKIEENPEMVNATEYLKILKTIKKNKKEGK